MGWGSLVPRLSPCANGKSKERGEPGKIYYMRNASGRAETLIKRGQVNELAHTLLTEWSSECILADRMGLILHYTTLPGSTASYDE